MIRVLRKCDNVLMGKGDFEMYYFEVLLKKYGRSIKGEVLKIYYLSIAFGWGEGLIFVSNLLVWVFFFILLF